MATIPQVNFSRGEISPDFWYLTNVEPFYSGLARVQNGYVKDAGAVSNRAGTEYLAPVYKHDKKVRLEPFSFGKNDTHVLEFGDEYIRILRFGSHVLEAAVSITSVTQANPAVFTTGSSHGYTSGDEIFVTGIGGMVELNDQRFKITVLSATTFSVQDQVDETDVDSTSFAAYTTGGTAARVLTIPSPITEAQLPTVRISQTFDSVLITSAAGRRVLKRLAVDNWVLELPATEPSIPSPAGLAVTVGTTGSVTARYAVTALKENEEESLASLASSGSSITAATKADPCVISFGSDPGFRTGHEIRITGVVGMTELNNRRYRLVRVTGTTYQLQGIDSTNFATYVSGGTATPAFVAITNGAATPNNTLTWSAVPGAVQYFIYKERSGVFGFFGETQDTTFLDNTTALPDISDPLPLFIDPFFGEGNNPTATTIHQQRRVYAGRSNNSSIIHASQLGSPNNFSRSVSLKDTDAFDIDFAIQDFKPIQSLVSFRDLLVFTDSSFGYVRSLDQAGFTFSSVTVDEQDSVGATSVPPLIVKQRVLFEQIDSSNINALEYSFSKDAYPLDNIATWSPHLFEGRSIVQWCVAEYVTAVMSDGKAVFINYNPEEQSRISGFSTFETSGVVESVCASKLFPAEDYTSPVFVVKRVLNGRTVRYIERLQKRKDSDTRDLYYLDCGDTADEPIAITNMTHSSGTVTVTTAAAHGLSNGDVVEFSDVVFMGETARDGTVTRPTHLNFLRFEVSGASGSTFTVSYTPTGTFVYDSGGFARKQFTVVSGARHLAGERVTLFLDGGDYRDILVAANGDITLPTPACRVSYGLPYVFSFVTLPLAVPSRAGRGSEIAPEIKLVSELGISFVRTRGGFVGVLGGRLREWKQRLDEKLGEPNRLYSGTDVVNVEARWSRPAQVEYRQVDPYPVTIAGIYPNAVL